MVMFAVILKGLAASSGVFEAMTSVGTGELVVRVIRGIVR